MYTRTKTDYNYLTLKKTTNNVVNYPFSGALNLVNVRTGSAVVDRKGKIRINVQAGSAYTLDGTQLVSFKPVKTVLVTKSRFSPFPVTTVTVEGTFPVTASVIHLSGSTVDVENEALMKIIRKVRSEHSHMNGQSFVGELRDTIRQLRHPFQSMRDQVYSHLTRLSKRKASLGGYPPIKRQKAWRQAVADTWLETSFGIKPLIHDTKDIAESLARFMNEPPRRARLQSHVEGFDCATTYTPNSPNVGDQIFNRVDRTETTRFCSYSVGMRTEVVANSGATGRLLNILGFTPENFVPALYEVMPWSWLADYFSNIGDIIEAATTNTADVKWIVKTRGFRSVRTVITQSDFQSTRRQYYPLNVSSGVNWVSNVGGNDNSIVQLSRATLYRTLPDTLGVPAFRLTHPFESLGKMANLGAVLTQFSGKQFDPSWVHLLPSYRPSGTRWRRGA